MATTRDLQREIEAAKVLREQLASLNDEELTRDMIEGETDLIEMIGRMVKQDGEDAAHVSALKAYAQEMTGRRERIEDRIETRRTLLATAMEQAGRKKAETAYGTITLSPVAPSLVTTDESAIPSGYWTPQPPKLDKRALLDDLKAAREIAAAAALIDNQDERAAMLATIKEIPGALLSNGAEKITIRRK